MSYPADSPLWEFRNSLLRNTIAWCVERSQFYRERLGEIAADFRGAEDLHRLPILRREEILANLPRLLCEQSIQPAHLQYTTGTTGQFLPLMRSPAESKFISDFYAKKAEVTPLTGPRPLWLSLTSTYHGSPTPLPGQAYVLSAGVYDLTQVSQATELLTRQWDFPGVESRVSRIVGGDILLKALTAHLLSEGIDPASLGVKNLVITGGYMTSRRKKWLSELWGARLQDRYSMAEVFGGASEVGIGGPWTFDSEVVPEVVHPGTLEPIDSGVGVLVLTGLYPFMQMMPVVRYYTGDLVQIVRACDARSEQMLVRFVGRERRAVLEYADSDLTALILPSTLHDVLERFADIHVSTRFADIRAGSFLELAGKLHYALEQGRDDQGNVRQITLTLGLRYPPQLYPERTAEIVSQIRDALYGESPALCEAVAAGRLGFDVRLRTAAEVGPFNAK
jgi:phenylacetate-coenzyme A ligase PaaK-like adenylate-forming protein